MVIIVLTKVKAAYLVRVSVHQQTLTVNISDLHNLEVPYNQLQ